ncbi:DNA-binding transcriptional regulator, LysR family [Geodermatophilus telluris]|uniref:DNA-binding transcriptional regulator, LysR family n=1 Tax=Geodermatophilus telluris TaxID=1190417 RepID=A0A1G6QHD0_9ACTN|nr:DNA-binding transcriptional regulator, LysR family [Geodermatophilus telluris]
MRDLRSFLAVADERHVTRAAQRLFVSQPALSRQIRALEQHLRTPLFVRGPSGVALTPAGRLLQDHARRVVAAWDEAQAAVAAAVTARARVLVVGLTISVGRGLLPVATRAFQERHPDVRVELRQAGFGDATAGLADGDADLAFCWLPLPPDAGVRHRVLFTEPRMVALPVDHRLTARTEVSVEDLLDEPFLALPESAGPLRSFWLGEDARGGRPARVAAVVHGPEEVVEALGRGLGVALISGGNAEIYRRPEFVVRPVRGLAPAHLAVVWREGDGRGRVQDFVRSCAAAAAASAAGPGAA